MFFVALATDYDGTIAHDGIVDAAVIAAMEQFKASGRRLILVAGRELPHLKEVFPEFRLFDRIVAENGAPAHQRHTRKYAEGELGADRSFYFRGPNGALNLRAQNLVVFLQMADGVDDGTWQFHRRKGDFSRWVRESIKDEDLARQLSEIESDDALGARESRKRVAEAVQARYTAPARAE